MTTGTPSLGLRSPIVERNYNKRPKQTPLHGWNPFARSMLVYACEYIAFLLQGNQVSATFRDDVKLFNEAFRHFTIVFEVIVFVNRR